jgi:hypothetical protein
MEDCPFPWKNPVRQTEQCGAEDFSAARDARREKDRIAATISA